MPGMKPGMTNLNAPDVPALAKTCLVLRHLAFEDLGTLAPVLTAADYAIAIHDLGVGPLPRDQIASADLLVVLGGPIGVYESAVYPFLTPEIAAIRARLGTQRPTLGICLGHQLIATALGAVVAPGPAKEIGWGLVQLTRAGDGSVLAPLRDVPVLHWHGDSAELPAGAVCLAETDICRNQAFAIGRHVLALQFHIEVDPGRIEQWLVGHTMELAKAGIDPRAIRADTAQHGPAMAKIGPAIVARWLEGIA
jgi:GMP synthase (glutamine-hydrolysing)